MFNILSVCSMHVQYAHALDECALCCKIMKFKGDIAMLQFLFRTHMEYFLRDIEITPEPHNFATQCALVQSIEYSTQEYMPHSLQMIRSKT